MKTKIAVSLIVLFAAAGLKAAEHPREHPSGGSALSRQEPPAGRPAPASEGSQAWLKQVRAEYVGAVCGYVKTKSKEPFVLHDDRLNKDWELKLVRVHKDKIVPLGKDRFFACSDFKSVKKGDRGKLDLDFFASKKADGGWEIDKVLIHKVNGKPRYTWNEKNEMVPARN